MLTPVSILRLKMGSSKSKKTSSSPFFSLSLIQGDEAIFQGQLCVQAATIEPKTFEKIVFLLWITLETDHLILIVVDNDNVLVERFELLLQGERHEL